MIDAASSGGGKKALGDAAVDAIYAERNYSNLGSTPRKTGVLHASGLRWSLAGLSDTWVRLREQAGHGDPVTVDAVVSAYFKQQSVDETTPSGKVAYTKLVEKLSTELDWLPALEQFLLKHKTGQAQGPQGKPTKRSAAPKKKRAASETQQHPDASTSPHHQAHHPEQCHRQGAAGGDKQQQAQPTAAAHCAAAADVGTGLTIEHGAALLGQSTQLAGALGLQQPSMCPAALSMQALHSSEGMPPPQLHAMVLGLTEDPKLQAAFQLASMLLPGAQHGQSQQPTPTLLPEPGHLAAALAAAGAGGSAALFQHGYLPMAQPPSAPLLQQVGMQPAAASEAAGRVQPEAVKGQQDGAQQAAAQSVGGLDGHGVTAGSNGVDSQMQVLSPPSATARPPLQAVPAPAQARTPKCAVALDMATPPVTTVTYTAAPAAAQQAAAPPVAEAALPPSGGVEVGSGAPALGPAPTVLPMADMPTAAVVLVPALASGSPAAATAHDLQHDEAEADAEAEAEAAPIIVPQPGTGAGDLEPALAAALWQCGWDPASDIDWRKTAAMQAQAYIIAKEQLKAARQQLADKQAVLQQIGTLLGTAGAQPHAGPPPTDAAPVLVLVKPEKGHAGAGTSQLGKRAADGLGGTKAPDAARRSKKAKLPAEQLISLQRISGPAVRMPQEPQEPVQQQIALGLEQGQQEDKEEMNAVQVWRLSYQGQQYYLDVDGVMLLGNNFNARLFGRAKNHIGRTAKKEHQVKIGNYKQVLRDSGLEHMPALGGGNMRRLLSFDGMVGLVCDLLKAKGVDEHQLLQGVDDADVDAAGVVSKQLRGSSSRPWCPAMNGTMP